MNRIQLSETLAGLKEQGRKALAAYVTAGDPGLDETLRFMEAIAAGGADIIELGVPFSDPIADGKVIQEAVVRSLARGTSLKDILSSVARWRTYSDYPQTPVVLLMYYNSVLAYGLESFAADAASAGVDGLVIPDLPLEESGEMMSYCRVSKIALIRFLAPTTTDDRAAVIVKDAEAFLYCVSVTGVTGLRQGIAAEIGSQMARYQRFTNLPLLVGFGISSPEDAQEVAKHSDGVIIGTAIVKLISDTLNAGLSVEKAAAVLRNFISDIRTALDN